MHAARVVVAVDAPRLRAEVVLSAALGGQVVVVAAVLRDLMERGRVKVLRAALGGHIVVVAAVLLNLDEQNDVF
jgi:hypothetical protein